MADDDPKKATEESAEAPDPMAAFRHTNVFAARRVFGFGPPRPPVCRLAATPVPSTSETEENPHG